MQNFPSAIKSPYIFASDANALVSDIGTDIGDGLSLNFPSGVPPAYSILPENGGKYFERGIVNSIGKMASIGSYVPQIGYMYTYEPDIADAIGGYPKGTILRYTDASGNTKLVQSCIANNNNNFVSDPTLIDGKKWIVISRQTAEQTFQNLFPSYSTSPATTSIYYYNDTAKPIIFSATTDIASVVVQESGVITLVLSYKISDAITQTGIARALNAPISFFLKNGDAYYRLTNVAYRGYVQSTLYLKGGMPIQITRPEYSVSIPLYMEKGAEIVLRCDLGSEWSSIYVPYLNASYFSQKVVQP